MIVLIGLRIHEQLQVGDPEESFQMNKGRKSVRETSIFFLNMILTRRR